MKKGPQTVPAANTRANMLSDNSDVNLSSYVPDFDVFLNDCEVPSPSNMYGHSLFAEPPDYSLLGGNMEDSSAAYVKYHEPTSPDMFYDSVADQKPAQQRQHQLQLPQMHSPAMSDSMESSYGSAEYNQRLEDFGSSLLYGNVETTHLDLFAASILGSAIKKEVMQSDDRTSDDKPADQNSNCSTTPAARVIKSEIMDDNCCDSNGADADDGDFEKVQCLVLQQLTQEIEVACDALNISADPYKWSMGDVHSWLQWTLRQYNLPQISLEYFLLDGPSLCSLTEDNFRQLTMQHGDILNAQLEIWKTAASFQRDRKPTVTSLAPPPPYTREDSFVAFSSPHSAVNSRSVSPVQQNSPPAACVPDLGMVTGYNSDAGLQSDDEVSLEDGFEGTAAEKRAQPGQRIGGVGGGGASHSHIHLWQFLKELLINQQQTTTNSTCIRWLDRSKGVFKIEDSVRVARLWGKRKNRPAMNYDKLSRSIRQYYKKGIMKKTERSQRLVYQFCHPYCL